MIVLEETNDAWNSIQEHHKRVDADPLNGQTPYEVLGVDETETVGSIEQKAKEAHDHYSELRAETRREYDDEKYKRLKMPLKRSMTHGNGYRRTTNRLTKMIAALIPDSSPCYEFITSARVGIDNG